MRQAIVTKYLPPTNHRGGRVKATADAGSVVVSWNHAKDIPDNHAAAAKALAVKFGWLKSEQDLGEGYVGGGLPYSNAHAYAFVDWRHQL